MLTIFLGVAVSAIIFYTLFIQPLSYWKKRGVRYGNPLWLFGDSWGLFFRIQTVTEFVQYIYNQCPGTRYHGAYEFVIPTLVVKDPELIKQIAVKDFDYFVDHRDFIPENSDPLWSKGLFALKGQEWRTMRILLSPSFTSSKMKAMFVLMTECAADFIKYFLKKDDGITLEMKDVFTRFTNDVIATTAFGIRVDSLAMPNNQFYLMGKDVTDFSSFWRNFKTFVHLIFPQFSHLFKLNMYNREVKIFFSNLINETIKTREEKGIVRHDMIHLFMEARKGMEIREENGKIDAENATKTEEGSYSGKEKTARDITNEDIVAQALLFLFAGFDSVSGLMCFTAYELAGNPEIQELLRKEIQETLEECRGSLTYEGLMKMKYLDMVLSEVLRKWPTFPTAVRVCTKSFLLQPTNTSENLVHLEKGTIITFPTYAIQRDPKFYPDPDRFDPERFSETNKGNIQPYTYFPFGLGPRVCIGSRFALLETKVIFFYILQHFQLVPGEKTEIPLKMSKRGFTVNAANGFWLELKRINV